MSYESVFDNPNAYASLFGHFLGYYGRFLEVLAGSAIVGPESIVDLGSGIGDFTNLLSTRFPAAQVLGLDYSATFVRRARESFAARNLSFDTHPASKILIREDVRDSDYIFMKGCYHLFEEELPLDTFLDHRFRRLRGVIVIEKTERSLDTYPVPRSAQAVRAQFVSLSLARRRLAAPPGLEVRSFLYGEHIQFPAAHYMNAVINRQFSYLRDVPQDELSQWETKFKRMPSVLQIYEENIATVYYRK